MRKKSTIISFRIPSKPFLLDKVKSEETIILVNNDHEESKETKEAKTSNNFLSNII